MTMKDMWLTPSASGSVSEIGSAGLMVSVNRKIGMAAR
jgi:hypothetical protein